MIPPPKSPGFYLRVSTRAQEYASQRHALDEYCRRLGWTAPTKASFFCEKESGSKAKRRELDRLLAACRDGKHDAIVTYRADRIGRSFVHLVNIYAELKAAGIRIIGVADGVDTADESPGTNFYKNMLASVAQLTREIIVENTIAGLKAAKKRGRFGGRRPTKTGKVMAAMKLKASGKLSLTEISKRTGLSKGYLSDLFNGNAPLPKSA